MVFLQINGLFVEFPTRDPLEHRIKKISSDEIIYQIVNEAHLFDTIILDFSFWQVYYIHIMNLVFAS
jgi:hypothetical protein